MFDEIHYLLETTVFSRKKGKNQGTVSESSEFIIWEAKQIRSQNTDSLIDCSDQ